MCILSTRSPSNVLARKFFLSWWSTAGQVPSLSSTRSYPCSLRLRKMLSLRSFAPPFQAMATLKPRMYRVRLESFYISTSYKSQKENFFSVYVFIINHCNVTCGFKKRSTLEPFRRLKVSCTNSIGKWFRLERVSLFSECKSNAL